MAPILGTAILFGIVLVPAAITLLKGHLPTFFAGLLLIGLVWIVAAFRLARPGSWWARRFYDERKMWRAVARYGAVESAG